MSNVPGMDKIKSAVAHDHLSITRRRAKNLPQLRWSFYFAFKEQFFG
jgi:hypothetical protein